VSIASIESPRQGPSSRWRRRRTSLVAAAPKNIQGYRPDVDGLRAIAVLSVVLFHLSARILPGGFVGVDIFFVISGYLISGILFKEHAAGRFSFKEFYGRRIRRLGPALYVVLIAVLGLGWVFLFSPEYQSVGRHTAFSSVFSLNLLLYKEVDYFAAAADETPLLHLWSLGIEEQFYLLWPLLLWLARKRLPSLTVPLLVATGLSFVACVLTTRTSPEAAFYLPHTRYWEFLVGALLAYRETRYFGSRAPSFSRAPEGLPSKAASLLSWGGVMLIGVALIVLGSGSGFPGWKAALPVAGTAAVIGAGPGAWLNRTIIGNRLMAYVGTLAYPIYLWHWPLLVLVNLVEPTRLLRVLAVVATMILSWATKTFVEDRFRFGRWSKGPLRHATAGALFVALLAIGAVGFVVDRAEGFPSRFPEALRPLTNYGTDEATSHTAALAAPRCFLTPRQGPESFPASCGGVTGGHDSLLVWGDSFGDHLDAGLRKLAEERQFTMAEYTASSCPPILGLDTEPRFDCRHIIDFVFAKAKAVHYPTVILAANWILYGEQVSHQISRTVQALENMRVAHVIIVGPLPSWPSALPAMLARTAIRSGLDLPPPRVFNTSLEETLVMDRLMRGVATSAGADYISVTDILCDEGRTCLTLVPGEGLTPMQFDTVHLTPEGSRYVVRAMASRLDLP
jgi:peptidoglycan/LPS O-acetylase OafA/YrhL